MLGTVLNSISIILGSFIGVFFGSKFSGSLRDTFYAILGTFAIFMGIGNNDACNIPGAFAYIAHGYRVFFKRFAFAEYGDPRFKFGIEGFAPFAHFFCARIYRTDFGLKLLFF